jgi:hypothetical protein
MNSPFNSDYKMTYHIPNYNDSGIDQDLFRNVEISYFFNIQLEENDKNHNSYHQEQIPEFNSNYYKANTSLNSKNNREIFLHSYQHSSRRTLKIFEIIKNVYHKKGVGSNGLGVGSVGAERKKVFHGKSF